MANNALYRLRVTEGDVKGAWLWLLSVSKDGQHFTITDWGAVAVNPAQYNFHPKFIKVEDSAWGGISREAAERYQSILKHCGFLTEIVEPTKDALVSHAE